MGRIRIVASYKWTGEGRERAGEIGLERGLGDISCYPAACMHTAVLSNRFICLSVCLSVCQLHKFRSNAQFRPLFDRYRSKMY